MAAEFDVDTINAAYLERNVGRYVGVGRTTLTGDDQQDVRDAVESGMRSFYWHQYVEDGETVPHIWSFMRAEETISATEGVNTYTKTESYRKLAGSVVIFSGDNKGLLTVISDGDMRALRATDEETGEPKYISVLGTTVYIHPTPDGSYTIKYPIAAVPSLTNDLPTNQVFSELILVSCLAAADRIFNKETTANAERFQALLQAAVKYDRQLTDIDTEQVWPVDTSTSLELTKKRLDKIVGMARGFPADADIWSVGQKAEVKELTDAGLRKFYNPVVLPGDRYPHEWSFLRPMYTLNLKEDETYYDLPDDFAMVDGPIVYTPDDNSLYEPISEIGENQLRRRIQHSLGNSRPVCYATWTKEFDEQEGTRWELGVAPAPDADMDATMRYKINPMAMSSNTALPMGGPQYAQTIIEACLSAIEISDGKKGVHSQEFEQLLIASVRHDKNASTSDYLSTSKITAAYGYGMDDHVIGYGDYDIT